jgi:hypothetical protein
MPLPDNRNQYLPPEGTNQQDRRRTALKPGFFRVDHRGLREQVDFVARFSEFVAFIDEKNQPSGDWQNLIAHDPAVQLIRLAGWTRKRDVEAFHAGTKGVHAAVDADAAARSLQAAMGVVWKLLRRCADWAARTVAVPEFNKQINTIIEDHLAGLYVQLVAFEENGVAAGLLAAPDPFARPHLGWQVNKPDNGAPQDPGTAAAKRIGNPFAAKDGLAGKETLHVLQRAASDLERLFHELLSYLDVIRKDAGYYLNKQLNHRGDNKPHVALLLTFLRLMQYPQAELNAFTRRHLDYYYGQILKLQRKAGVPDQVHVCFELAPHVPLHRLEAGTLLAAGKDATGRLRTYRTLHELVVNQNRVTAMWGLQVTPAALRVMAAPAWSTPAPTPELGFAVAAPILLRGEGVRQFTLRLGFAEPFFTRFREALPSEQDVDGSVDPLDDFLEVEYSSPGGWTAVPRAGTETRFGRTPEGQLAPWMDVTLVLGDQMPPVAAVGDAAFAEAYRRQLPVFRFRRDRDNGPLYASVQHLVVESLRVQADVLGARSLKLYNDFGPLDPGAPFQPFGPLPALGSAFFVGCDCFEGGWLQDVRLNIEWFLLPLHAGGFKEYYAGYPYVEGNHSFKAKVSVLNGGQWKPQAEKQVINLFQDVPDQVGTSLVSNVRRVNEIGVDFMKLTGRPAALPADLPPREASGGYLKMELCYPLIAFGHREYPDVLKRAVAESVSRKRAAPLPNEAYTPTIKNLSIDYSIATEVAGGRLGDATGCYLYHLDPLTPPRVATAEGAPGPRLLSHYEPGTHLLLGIGACRPPQTLSLLFAPDPAARAAAEATGPVAWCHYAGGVWHPVPAADKVLDTTNGLQQPGIVRFELSEDVYHPGPDGVLVLKCLCPGYGAGPQSLPSVRTQAVQAVFENAQNDLAHLRTNLPAGSITGLVIRRPQLRSVYQPYPSFGGRPPEDAVSFHRRVSERLRHRDRAVAPADYERLVLEQFPFLGRAKCFCHRQGDHPDEAFRPGCVSLVVIPKANPREGTIEPRLTGSALAEIAAFLRERIPPSVRLDVRNPNYEGVRVKARVKFRAGRDGGYYLKQLDEDLGRHLNPWLDHPGRPPQFGEKLYGSSLVYFMETLEYVEVVANVMLFHLVDGQVVNRPQAAILNAVIAPARPDALLVSAGPHILELLDEADDAPGDDPFEGLHVLKMERDFVVLPDPFPEPGPDPSTAVPPPQRQKITMWLGNS